MKIEIKNRKKLINNRDLEQVLKDFIPSEPEYSIIETLFINISSEEELIDELRLLKKHHTPTEILLFIKVLGNLSISEANPIFEKVMNDF